MSAALGVDVDALAADVAVLHGVRAALDGRWAQTVATRTRAQDLGLLDTPPDDPLSGIAGLPERLRADLELLDGICEAAEAAWHGVVAVCARLAEVLGDVAQDLVDAVPEGGEDGDGVGIDQVEAGPGEAGPGERAVAAARDGVARIDRALGGLDGELVLIGGR